MANHSIKTVYSTPVLLSPQTTHSGVDITIQNLDSSASVLIGTSSLTTSSYGFKLLPDTAVSFSLTGKDELYGIAINTAGPISVAVLTLGLV